MDQIQEIRHTNLLPVVEVPARLFVCELSLRRIQDSDGEVPKDANLHEGKYIGFRDPRQSGSPASAFTDLSKLSELKFPEYVRVPETRNHVVGRWNGALDEQLASHGLCLKDRGNFYFPPNADGTPRSIEWSPMRRASAVRKVAYPYYGRQTGKLAFWVHHACRMAFCEVGGQFFLRARIPKV